MAKKVILDTLEIEETAVSLREDSARTEVEKVKPSVRWFPAKRILISLAILLVILCIIGLLYWWTAKSKTVPQAPVQNILKSTKFPNSQNYIYLNDFYIPLKVDKDNQRIMTFDLAFELNADKRNLFLNNMVRIRNNIYQTVNKKTANIALSLGSMNALRDEIIAELEKYLGKGAIKSLYFTRYLVL